MRRRSQRSTGWKKHIDYMNHAITDYLIAINQSTLPIDDIKSIGGLFHVVNDIERIGDHAENVADAAIERREKKYRVQSGGPEGAG